MIDDPIMIASSMDCMMLIMLLCAGFLLGWNMSKLVK